MTLGLLPALAQAETAHVLPFSNRCFDAGRFVSGMEARGIHIEVGASHVGPQVQIASVADGLDVRIAAHDEAGNETGVELRHIEGAACDAMLDTAELIVQRAVTPLHFMPETTPKPRTKKPVEAEKLAPTKPLAKPRQAKPTMESDSDDDDSAPDEQPVPLREIVREVRVLVPQIEVRRAPPIPRPPLRVELAVHGAWIFALDHAPSAVAGDVELGLCWSKMLGLALRVGVANHWRSIDRSGDSAATLEVRRVPFALLLTIDLALHHGGLRLAGGAVVDLWRVSSSGVSQSGASWAAQPALMARFAYRYAVRRVFFEAGVDLEVGVVQQDFVVTGVGSLSHTPLVDVSPYLGVGVTL